MTCHTLHAKNGGGGGRSDKWCISYYLLIFKFIITSTNKPHPLHGHLELFLLSGYIICVCGGGVGRGGGGGVGGVCLIIQIQV